MDCLGRDWSEGDVIGLCDKTLLATSSIFVTKNFVGNKLNICDKKLCWQQTQYVQHET